jgi:hypothetical protein
MNGRCRERQDHRWWRRSRGFWRRRVDGRRRRPDRGRRRLAETRCRRSLDDLRCSGQPLGYPGGGENDPPDGPLGRRHSLGRGPDGLPVDVRIVGRRIAHPTDDDGIGHQLLAEAAGEIDGPLRDRRTGAGRHRVGRGLWGFGILARTWCNVPDGVHPVMVGADDGAIGHRRSIGRRFGPGSAPVRPPSTTVPRPGQPRSRRPTCLGRGRRERAKSRPPDRCSEHRGPSRCPGGGARERPHRRRCSRRQ